MKKLNLLSWISVIFGIIGLIAWMVPPVGYIVSLAGLLAGMRGSDGDRKVLGMAGLILSVIGLVLCVAV